MLNPIVIPLMSIVGAVAANLNAMMRGDNKFSLNMGIKTFVSGAIAFASVWFALLITAIYTGGDTNTLAGLEVLALFVGGLFCYNLFNLGKLITPSLQVWLFRLSLPLIIIACLLVMLLG